MTDLFWRTLGLLGLVDVDEAGAPVVDEMVEAPLVDKMAGTPLVDEMAGLLLWMSMAPCLKI